MLLDIRVTWKLELLEIRVLERVRVRLHSLYPPCINTFFPHPTSSCFFMVSVENLCVYIIFMQLPCFCLCGSGRSASHVFNAYIQLAATVTVNNNLKAK